MNHTCTYLHAKFRAFCRIFQPSSFSESVISNYWTMCYPRKNKVDLFIFSYLFRFRKISWSRATRQRYFALTEFNNCFIIRSPSLFSYWNHTLHEQTIISMHIFVTWWALGHWNGRDKYIQWYIFLRREDTRSKKFKFLWRRDYSSTLNNDHFKLASTEST